MEIKQLQKIIDEKHKNGISFYQNFKITESGYEIDQKAGNTIRHLRHVLEKLNPSSVFDIGCNFGLYCLESSKYATRILGIDTIKDSIDSAKIFAEHFSKSIEYRVESFTDYNSDELFDLVIMCSVYHHIYRDYKNHSKIFEKLSTITKSVFLEVPVGMEDISCNTMFDHYMPEEKQNFNIQKIFEGLTPFFYGVFLGMHSNETRMIFLLERKW